MGASTGAVITYGFSSVGRALVSKTRCREFEPLNPCKTTTNNETKTTDDIQEAYDELRFKTSWPSKKQLVKSAIIVMIASVIIALIIFLMDQIVDRLMHFIYSF